MASQQQAFTDLGICKEITDVIAKLGWDKPSEIQSKAIPVAFRGRDIVGLAETGSGKTAAFAIPILQDLITKPKHNFALILTPTRELALQIKAHLLDLGAEYGLKVACLVGGQHVEDQQHDLKRSQFHIIIGTPGRVAYHIQNTKELRLNRIRYLVLDEADQMLEDTFEEQLALIVDKLPTTRRTYMYSATMSQQCQKISSLCLRQPVVLETTASFAKVDKLEHAFVFLPDQERDVYVVYLLSQTASAEDNRSIVFTATWRESFRLSALLKSVRHLIGGLTAAPLNGAMQQEKRQSTLFDFRSGKVNILVATDLAARGLDIPAVNLVLNYDVPRRPSWSDSAKAYIHRVGRTARAGRLGRAVTLVTPYSATRLKAIEAALEHEQRVPQLPWPGVRCLEAAVREAVLEADVRARSGLREKDKRKRLQSKKRQLKRQRRAESFADPVKFGSANDSSDGE